MTLLPHQRELLEGIAYSDDPAVTPRDRLDAIKVLAEHPDGSGRAAGLELALWVTSLSEGQVAEEAPAIFAQVSEAWGAPAGNCLTLPDVA